MVIAHNVENNIAIFLFDPCFTSSVNAVLYVISCYTIPRNNRTRLFMYCLYEKPWMP